MLSPSTTRRAGVAALAATALLLTAITGAAPAVAANDVLDPSTKLYVNPVSTTAEAAAGLSGQARADAQLLAGFPSASWFTKGTPAEVQAAVTKVVESAAAAGAVPVLVAYNLPFRDCAQYSAGGAADTAAYNAWIDAFAAGIGTREAVVILEPDGLGIIPWNTDINGNAEWCQPAELDPATAVSDRYAQLNHAVDALVARPGAAVYLDGTHSNWLGVGDISDRLIKAGVERADGFFVNASNYVQTERLVKYSHWISDCIHLSQNSWWEPAWCASQYYPATPSDFSTWGLSDAAYDQAFADTGLTRDPAVQAHAVIDTSRNGQGPWTPPAGVYPDPEDWCNPPDRGLGLRPTTVTDDATIDAYLWIKVPGESDGRCFRGTGGPADPARGMVDPEAGVWFPQQAAELIALAQPAVARPGCDVDYRVRIDWRGHALVTVKKTNTGTAKVDGWTLRWTLPAGQTIRELVGGRESVAAGVVTVENLRVNAVIKPGRSTSIGFLGKGGGTPEPLLFFLNDAVCTSR
jgi:endoglucanase